MPCAYPRSVYLRSQKRAINVPCRRCLNCRMRRRSYLSFCARSELFYAYLYRHQGATFVTLTYDDAHLPPNGSLCKADMQKYMKVLRVNVKRHLGNVPMKYLACGEYGDLGRPHYHIIFIGYSTELVQTYASKWLHGMSDIGVLKQGGIDYVLKYCMKQVGGKLKEEMYDNNGLEPPFICHSRDLGGEFVRDHLEAIQNLNYAFLHNGSVVPLPEYLRRKYDVLGGYDTGTRLIELDKQAKAAGFRSVYEYSTFSARMLERDLAYRMRSCGMPVEIDYEGLVDVDPVSCKNLAIEAEYGGYDVE